MAFEKSTIKASSIMKFRKGTKVRPAIRYPKTVSIELNVATPQEALLAKADVGLIEAPEVKLDVNALIKAVEKQPIDAVPIWKGASNMFESKNP